MKVMLIDDHPLILSALQGVIEGLDADVEVTGVASAQQARTALQADADVDLVLLDLKLPDADGHALLGELRAAHPALPVVVVSASERSADVVRAIDAGAMGYVCKRSTPAQLREALGVVLSGGLVVPPRLADDGAPPHELPHELAHDAAHGAGGRALACRPVPGRRRLATRTPCLPPGRGWRASALTPRQRDVLGLLLQGKPNKLIARELKLSVETVKDHVAAVLRVLNVNSRTQAVLTVSRMLPPAHRHPHPHPHPHCSLPAARAGVEAVAGVLSAPAPSAARMAAADRMRVMVLQTPAVLVGNALGVSLVAALFWQAAGAARVLAWAGVAAALWACGWRTGGRRAASARPTPWRCCAGARAGACWWWRWGPCWAWRRGCSGTAGSRTSACCWCSSSTATAWARCSCCPRSRACSRPSSAWCCCPPSPASRGMPHSAGTGSSPACWRCSSASPCSWGAPTATHSRARCG
jgi:DNA-binding NarL/FixJ family response regulator